MAAIELKAVSKRFGATEVIRSVSLQVPDGAFVVLVGPSGCGKSTLLRLIAGLEDISAGDMFFDGERVNDLPPKGRGVAMVFQSYALYPHMTAYQNMAFGLTLGKTDRRSIDERVRAAADMLELTSLLDRLPRELSGGQRQRVAIGRAIVRQPRVFLFDEPLSNLDAALRVQMRLELARLHEQLGTTVVYVTHDQVEAMTLADQVVVLSDGKVEQVGPPLTLYHQPANRFVAGFIGSPRMNFMDVTVRHADAGGVSFVWPGGAVSTLHVDGRGLEGGQTLTLGVRPEHLELRGTTEPTDQQAAAVPGEICLSGRLQRIESLGDSSLLHVRLPGAALMTVRCEGQASVAQGATLALAPDLSRCHLFRPDGDVLAPLHARDVRQGAGSAA